MALLSERDAQVVREQLSQLQKKIEIRAYLQKINCDSCPDAEAILKELSGLSDMLEVRLLNPQIEGEEAEADSVDRVPTIVVSDGENSRARFIGTPSGYEFSSLLATIIETGTEKTSLNEKSADFLGGLEDDLDIKVFVTPNCPYCPGSAVLAHRMAIASPRVTSEVIEANEFMDLSGKYEVRGVPRTVVNDRIFVEGALPEDQMIEALDKALAEGSEEQVNLMELLQADQGE
ncbi:glutaredoxin [Candidatus Fermentibacteria bacterium]|nr:glutaredoxin [Candidatus Fermentibacteria bacterium]